MQLSMPRTTARNRTAMMCLVQSHSRRALDRARDANLLHNASATDAATVGDPLPNTATMVWGDEDDEEEDLIYGDLDDDEDDPGDLEDLDEDFVFPDEEESNTTGGGDDGDDEDEL